MPVRRAMKVLVTGAANPVGRAIIDALLADGHEVRAFGIDAKDAAHLPDHEALAWYPGHLATGGSIEPVLAQRDALVHAACLDTPTKDRAAFAKHVEHGTLYTRYGAEREMVDVFVHVAPEDGGRFAASQDKALATVQGIRGNIPLETVRHGGDAAATAAAVVAALAKAKGYGLPPGKQAAVTA